MHTHCFLCLLGMFLCLLGSILSLSHTPAFSPRGCIRVKWLSVYKTGILEESILVWVVYSWSLTLHFSMDSFLFSYKLISTIQNFKPNIWRLAVAFLWDNSCPRVLTKSFQVLLAGLIPLYYLYVHICVSVYHVHGSLGKLEELPGPENAVLRMVVNLIWVLGSKLRPSKH